VVRHREAFHGLEVQDIAELCLLLIERKKRERVRRRNGARGFFFPGHTCPAVCATPGFFHLLDSIKSCLKGHSLNFMCP
jgi:hypothetical protein